VGSRSDIAALLECHARSARSADGAANKIIDVFVKQADHRMGLERKVIEGDAQRASAGIVVGGFLA